MSVGASAFNTSVLLARRGARRAMAEVDRAARTHRDRMWWFRAHALPPASPRERTGARHARRPAWRLPRDAPTGPSA